MFHVPYCHLLTNKENVCISYNIFFFLIWTNSGRPEHEPAEVSCLHAFLRNTFSKGAGSAKYSDALALYKNPGNSGFPGFRGLLQQAPVLFYFTLQKIQCLFSMPWCHSDAFEKHEFLPGVVTLRDTVTNKKWKDPY